MKTCFTCKIQLPFSKFHKHNQQSDGFSPNCKDCRKLKSKSHYDLNKDKIKKRTNTYYHSNKSDILKQNKQYRELNVIKINERRKIYRQLNPNSKQRWLDANPIHKAAASIRKRLWAFIDNKTDKFDNYIGCTYNELKIYLESQFRDGMSWENYGDFWQIDHIFPLSKARTDIDVFTLSHFTNLQPLLSSENKSKNNKITLCWQKVLRKKTEHEDKKLGLPFDLKIKDLHFNRETLTNEHIDFIKRYEWLGCIGVGITDVFTARWQNKLCGIVMMSQPNKEHFGICESLIHRGASASWGPENLGSKLVMFACRWMVANTDKRIFTAYSDPEAGEVGTIYQACNFDYLGHNFGAKTLFKLDSGKEVNRRYFTRSPFIKSSCIKLGITYSTDFKWSNLPIEIKSYIKLEMKRTRFRVPDKKGKYVLLLNYGKNKLKKTWVSLPYPKRIL